MTHAASHGIPVTRFWLMTPKELAVELEGAAMRADRERQQAMSVAWHVVAFDRTKRLPSHETLMRKLSRRRRRAQAVEEQIAMARLITAQWHGTRSQS